MACFDTAFHATIPEAAATFALPAEWRARWTLRRYGFHGLSHSYVSRRAAELVGHRAWRRTGCASSPATWARARRSRRCTAAGRWTPPWGSPRSTAWSWRPGQARWTPASCCGLRSTRTCRRASSRPPWRTARGLTGLAGTGDMREVLSRAAAGDARAVLGRDVYLHRLRGVHRRDGRRHGRPRRPRLHRRRRRELTGDPLPRRRRPRLPRRRRRRVAQRPGQGGAAARTGRSPPRRAAVRTFVIAAREDRQMPRRSARSEVRSLCRHYDVPVTAHSGNRAHGAAVREGGDVPGHRSGEGGDGPGARVGSPRVWP